MRNFGGIVSSALSFGDRSRQVSSLGLSTLSLEEPSHATAPPWAASPVAIAGPSGGSPPPSTPRRRTPAFRPGESPSSSDQESLGAGDLGSKDRPDFDEDDDDDDDDEPEVERESELEVYLDDDPSPPLPLPKLWARNVPVLSPPPPPPPLLLLLPLPRFFPPPTPIAVAAAAAPAAPVASAASP
ncbi:hypothetical protein M231_07600 [Tremella mesenterica]|uniref:Uncharacterized protein n=1 Tax=Tremella mesenterica TaxID=5217 RepID=A0A4Q1B906_TREME|nr:hypothetical protein M231_07600 [Tremella mesenterica]